jgi:hypothetical protein
LSLSIARSIALAVPVITSRRLNGYEYFTTLARMARAKSRPRCLGLRGACAALGLPSASWLALRGIDDGSSVVKLG